MKVTLSRIVPKMPSWDISLGLANAIYTTSWIGLLFGAAITAIATGAAYWSSTVRDRYSDERTAVLEASTEQAKLEQARIGETNLRLQIDLERERGARIKIEAGLASRRVSDEQCLRIRERLANAGSIPQILIITQADEEQAAYAEQLLRCLQQTGTHVALQRNGIMMGVPPGLHVQLPASAGGAALREAFEQAGIEANYFVNAGSSITITTGPKPQRF
jgi:hypothetical protein